MTRQAVCPACNAANRIGAGEARSAKCGRCGAMLFQGRAIDVDDSAFGAHVCQTKGAPVVVDVWAPWCGPCRMMAPHFEEAARRIEPEARFLKLSADEGEAPRDLGVRAIPALIVFRDGREIARHAGFMGADALVAWLKANIENTHETENKP